MVLVQNPLNKKLSHTLSLTYPNLYGGDKRRIKKALKINKIKRRNSLSFSSTDESFEHLKSNNYFGSQYEKEIVPRTQNNTERTLRKNGAVLEELDQFNWKMEDDNEDENSIEFQYGTLIGNEKVTNCVQKFLSNWDSFIGDLGEGEKDNSQMDTFTNQTISKIEEEENSSSYKVWLPNNSGYLTPTSQKDDECYSETMEQEQKGSTSEKETNNQTEMDEEISKYSPAIIDDFDEICPFENDYNEDERIRSILNAEVLPSDYIGKIPSIPEKPIGYLGRLMKKYNF